MKTKTLFLLGSAIVHSSFILSAAAQGAAFTYQGRFTDGGGPATGSYDFAFSLFNASSGGSAIGTPRTNGAVAVTNGLFTVTLDFGANFPGADRWLEIAARTNSGGTFTTLSPRQQITATPYAVTAREVTGSVAAEQLTGTIQMARIGAGSIHSNHLALGSIHSNLLAVGAIHCAGHTIQCHNGRPVEIARGLNLHAVGQNADEQMLRQPGMSAPAQPRAIALPQL